jgi:hypothetical protein
MTQLIRRASRTLGAASLIAGVVSPALAADPFDGLLSGQAVCPVSPSASSRPPVGTDQTRVPDAPASVAIDDPFARDLLFMRWFGIVVDPVSEEIPIEIRVSHVGLTIRADVRGSADEISVELLDPKGQLIACEECPDAPAVGEAKVGRGTTQMPSTDRPGWELDPGLYSFRVRAIPIEGGAGGSGPLTATVTASLRTDAAVTVEHQLDLNFIYLPDCGLTPAIVDTSFHFAQFLERADVWMEPTGIQIGRVTHRSLDRPEFSVVATWKEAGRMFRTSAEVGRPRTLNVYCYDTTEPGSELSGAVGFSGGIPGPAFNGTRDSGIALKTSPFMNCVPPNDKGYSCLDAYASLFAHEVGHYLGFYHTTEADLEDEDPLSDTPRCEEANLRDCPDYDYVMFPLIHLANWIWSGQQNLIAKTHPIVRTVPVVGSETGRTQRTVALESSPNPFRESVSIRQVGGWNEAPLGLSVYDVTGRRIRELAPAPESVTWDGRDENGRAVPAGVYFVRARQGVRAENLRVVKLR